MDRKHRLLSRMEKSPLPSSARQLLRHHKLRIAEGVRERARIVSISFKYLVLSLSCSKVLMGRSRV